MAAPAADSLIEIEGRASGTTSPFRIVRNDRVYERLFVFLKIEYEDGVTLYRSTEVNPADRTIVEIIHIPADIRGP